MGVTKGYSGLLLGILLGVVLAHLYHTKMKGPQS